MKNFLLIVIVLVLLFLGGFGLYTVISGMGDGTLFSKEQVELYGEINEAPSKVRKIIMDGVNAVRSETYWKEYRFSVGNLSGKDLYKLSDEVAKASMEIPFLEKNVLLRKTILLDASCLFTDQTRKQQESWLENIRRNLEARIPAEYIEVKIDDASESIIIYSPMENPKMAKTPWVLFRRGLSPNGKRYYAVLYRDGFEKTWKHGIYSALPKDPTINLRGRIKLLDNIF